MRRRLLGWFNAMNIIRHVALLIFAVQFVRWFANYWQPVTAELVYAVLGVAFVVELVLSRQPLWARLLLQAVGVIIAHLVVLDWQWYGALIVWDSLEFTLYLLQLFFEPFVPYVWFGLAAWLIYVLLNIVLQTREQVFLVTVLSVIALAIADSYTSIYLWDETALVVISGLVLMINRHFTEFRNRHPHTWKYISEYPWGITLTAGALVAFIILMSIIAPNVRPLLVDPYTAWNQLQGRSVNFSQKEDTPRALTSFALNNLVSSSGYGRDDSRLGGSFNYNYDPIFRVTSRVRSYWRGESKSLYTGEGWLNADVPTELQVFGIGQEILPEVEVDASLPLNEFTQQITMVSEDDPPKIFGAYPMSRIDMVNGSTELEVFFSKNLTTGAVEKVESDVRIHSYTVTSAVPVASEEWLMQAPEPARNQELQPYLQLPDTVPERVYQLAQDITAGLTTQYEKVKAVENYLKHNYSYSNTPDESRGRSEDFVDRFLFEIMEGYCDYFSTAMAVMLRTLDIPTRWVKGYTSGMMNDESTLLYEQAFIVGGAEMTPDLDLTYVVRNADAHSWVEVYFEGYGWMMFEPTAGFSAPIITAPTVAADEVAVPVVAPETTSETSPVEGLGSGYGTVIMTLAATVVIIAAVLLWLFVFRAGNVRLERIRQILVRYGLMRAPVTPNEKIVVEFNRLMRYLKRKGLLREEHQTVREAVANWRARLPSVDAELMELLHGFEQAKYSSRLFSEHEAESYQRRLREVRKRVKRIA